MAEALLRHEWRKYPGAPPLRAVSAGLAAAAGEELSEHARTVLREAGVAMGPHRATSLTGDLVDSASLILVMSGDHRRRLLQRYPAAAGKIYLLKEFARLNGHPEVADPFGGSLEEYRRVFAELRAAMARIAAHLERGPDHENCFGR